MDGSRTDRAHLESQGVEVLDAQSVREQKADPFFAKVIDSQKSYAKTVMNYLNLNQPDYKLAYKHYFG